MLYVPAAAVEVEILDCDRKDYAMGKALIHKCKLYTGNPYIAEHEGKYHVMQGSMQKSDVQVWRDTVEEAVERWNHRLENCRLKGETVSVEIL
jgi:hypothetical protein